MNKRNSKLELLRIISIIMIIISHYTVHNYIINYTLPLGFNRFILEFSLLGNIGVIIFILISGYFMINQTKIKLKKLIKLVFQVLFYSCFIYILLVILKYNTFNTVDFIKACLPITFKEYWFATAYILLYVFSPFINIFLNSLNKEKYIVFIGLEIATFSILPIVTNNDFYGNELIQFIMFYSIGGYIRLHISELDAKFKKTNMYLLFLSIFFLAFSIIIFDVLGIKYDFFLNKSSYFFQRNSPITLMLAVSLFNIFVFTKPKYNKIINELSSLTFGVYIIHDNKYIRTIIWSKIFKISNYVNCWYMIFHLIGCVALIYIVCSVIEGIRKNTIEKSLFVKLDDKIDKLQVCLEKNITSKIH